MRIQIDPGTVDHYTIDDYYSQIYRRKWIVIFMVTLTVGFAIAASYIITPRYEAKTVFYVPDDIAVRDGTTSAAVSPARLPTGVVEHAKAYIGILQGKDAAAAIHAQFPHKTLEDLNRDVDFTPTRGGLIGIYVRDTDPQIAAEIANAYYTYFNNFHRVMAEKTAAESLKRIDERLVEVTTKLDEARVARKEFLEKNNIASLNTAVDEYEKQRALTRQSLQLASADLRDAEDRLVTLQSKLKAEGVAYQSGDITPTNMAMDLLRQTLSDIEIDLAAKRARWGDKHPQVLALVEKQRTAKANLDAEIKKAVANAAKQPDSIYESLRQRLALAQVDRDGAAGRVKKLSEELEQISTAIAAFPATLAQADKYNEAIQQQLDARRDLENARNDLLQSTLKQQNSALVVETAKPPRNAVFPILWLNIATATVFGLVLGVLYSLFLSHLEARRRMNRLVPFEGLEVQLQPTAILPAR